MSFWKQLVLALVLIVVAGYAGLKLSPGAAGFVASHGFSGPLRALGLLGAPAESPAGQAGAGPAAGAAPAAGAGKGRVAKVRVREAGQQVINDKVTALGTSAALQSVMVMPKASGTLTEILVQSGAHVEAGQLIARLDSTVQEIARDKARLAVDDANRTVERNHALVQSNAAPATQTQAVELAAQLAVLNLRAAEQDLADRSILAPISGVVGILKINPGNAVTAQTELVSIEDSSALVVNFWLPERLVGKVKVGADAALVPVAHPDQTLSARVSSIDNQIDPASGTFQVQAEVANRDGNLQPGMGCTVLMTFPGESFVTVDPLSVQWGSDGAYVWRVVTDAGGAAKVEKIAVRIMQRNTESVLVAGALKPGDVLVTEGLDGLKSGATVQLSGDHAATGAGN